MATCCVGTEDKDNPMCGGPACPPVGSLEGGACAKRCGRFLPVRWWTFLGTTIRPCHVRRTSRMCACLARAGCGPTDRRRRPGLPRSCPPAPPIPLKACPLLACADSYPTRRCHDSPKASTDRHIESHSKFICSNRPPPVQSGGHRFCACCGTTLGPRVGHTGHRARPPASCTATPHPRTALRGLLDTPSGSVGISAPTAPLLPFSWALQIPSSGTRRRWRERTQKTGLARNAHRHRRRRRPDGLRRDHGTRRGMRWCAACPRALCLRHAAAATHRGP